MPAETMLGSSNVT